MSLKDNFNEAAERVFRQKLLTAMAEEFDTKFTSLQPDQSDYKRCVTAARSILEGDGSNMAMIAQWAAATGLILNPIGGDAVFRSFVSSKFDAILFLYDPEVTT